MDTLTIKEQRWGALAHVPIITIVWSCYLLYRYWYGQGLNGSLFDFHIVSVKSLPITPILFTLMSLPISLSIRRLNKESNFVKENATEAYRFSIWLLKIYMVCFLVAFLGLYFSVRFLLLVSEITGLVMTLFCFVQAVMGVYTTLTLGRVYHYWYPRRAL